MTRSPTYITGLCVAATIVTQASTRSATPGPRIGHGLAFDEARGRTVLFGGFGPDGVPQSDTWEWDGEAWQLSSKEGPSARRWPAMVYDAARGHVILFGGREGVGRGGASRGDTWEWGGKVWKELRSDDGPSGRDHHAMVYGDTWVWDGQRWTEIPVDGPSRRYVYSMSYGSYELDRKRALFFGGGHRESDRWVLFDETWLWNGSQWQKPDRQ